MANANEPIRPPVIVLTGPTGVGKTALSIDIARSYQGEIVSADSRQLYRGMDIGTGKATPAEQAAAPHHLLDIRDPDQTLSLAEYQELATSTIQAIHARGNLPLLVGGTALYIKAVTRGMKIPSVPPDPELRDQLEVQLADEGLPSLVARLLELDPTAEATIDLRNPRRVIRALEIVLLTGTPKSELEGEEPPPWRILSLCLTRPRLDLYRRIDARVDAMVAEGLVEETRRLLDQYDPTLPALSSLGYRETGLYLKGKIPLAAAVERIKLETHRYVRQQETFLRKMEELEWLDLNEVSTEAILSRIGVFLDLSGDASFVAVQATDMDQVMLLVATGTRSFDPAILIELQNYVAGRQFSATKIERRGDHQGLGTAEAHYRKHVIDRKEWPDGTALDGYIQSGVETVRNATHIFAGRYGSEWQLTFLAPSGQKRGSGGHSMIVIEYSLREGHWITLFQPYRSDLGVDAIASHPARSQVQWLRRP